MDIYFFSAIVNVIWYMFTILFLLYRFTTFFSWIWDFLKFLVNLMSCFKWLGNKISYIYNYYYNGYRQPFSEIEHDDLEENPYEPLLDKNEKSMIMKVKDNIVNLLPGNWFQHNDKINNSNNDLYELHISELKEIPKFHKKEKSSTQISFEHAYFSTKNESKFNSVIDWDNNDKNTSFGNESNLLLESKFINDFNNKKKDQPAVLQITPMDNF
jgi:hypothetical protein